MSSDSRTNIMDENNKNENIVATYHRRDVHFDSTPSYTSSLFVHLRQLQNDFQTQYQHEKHALNELNERLRHFVDRVQHLEAQNAKYIAQIASYGLTSGFSEADIELNGRYLHLQSDLIAASHGSIDFGLEVEMYQLQSAIYQQLIDTEKEWKDERRLKLEQEYNQSSVILNSLRASNSDLGRQVESLYAARDDAYQKYLRLTHDWSNMKKQSKEWALNMQLLKNQIAFYKNLRSHSTRGYTSVSGGTFDVKQFWALELDKVIKSIRRDFEQLYGTFQRDMTVYYNTQLDELATEIEQALRYQSTEIQTFSTRECPPDGAYISLLNHSPDKTVDISRWLIKRQIDGKIEYRYTLPDGIHLRPTGELRIYSTQGAATVKSLKTYRSDTSTRQELVNNEIISWGIGDSTQTFLLNQHGEEKAVFSQTIAAANDNI
ncbi:unnamed protein product [Rotaria sp. Silwood1]|nr:unnamed protein product [Rotaria sp. Silwood1]CAF4893834.1 unnamed protein product [Rotaria sp. Silwood1]CAF4900359.1 unnamed protein product [Rotaria sp. Silwood1]